METVVRGHMFINTFRLLFCSSICIHNIPVYYSKNLYNLENTVSQKKNIALNCVWTNQIRSEFMLIITQAFVNDIIIIASHVSYLHICVHRISANMEHSANVVLSVVNVSICQLTNVFLTVISVSYIPVSNQWECTNKIFHPLTILYREMFDWNIKYSKLSYFQTLGLDRFILNSFPSGSRILKFCHFRHLSLQNRH